MNRRDFFMRMGGAAVAVPLIATLGGCGDDGSPRPDAAPIDAPNQTECTDGTRVTIGNNHGHVLVVSAEDVAAGVAKTYDIQGSSAHSHTVTLTAVHFSMLKDLVEITVISSTNSAHEHIVTIYCI